jgi:hypothetical protein
MSIEWKYQGIASILSHAGLRVPKHQREYSWKREQVEQLCEDFSGDTLHGSADYFLGTIVVTKSAPGCYQVVDGQQRLATATMILAAIRDIHLKRGEAEMANSVEVEYLCRFDHASEELTTNLVLNVKDNGYFERRVIRKPMDDERKSCKINGPSNRKIDEAARILRTHVESTLAGVPSEKGKKEALKEWVQFLKYKTKVALIEVDDTSTAYSMFETLNDRGLKVSKADLVKNYLFGLAGDSKIAEVENKWSNVVSTLATIGEDEDIADYLRIYCSLVYEFTRERMVFRRVKKHATTASSSVRFLEGLEVFATDYVAMLSPEHPKWNDYPEEIRRTLRTLGVFDVTQIRVLCLAVAHHFSSVEAPKAFRMFISWIVRLFIAGAGKVGRVEDMYNELAQQIHKKKIKTAADLYAKIKSALPSDEAFRSGFKLADVGKEKLARYYLDAMERKASGDDDKSELVPNEDTSRVNLEHIMPENLGRNWPKITPEIAKEYCNRIGNLALMNAKKNAAHGNDSFEKKKPTLAIGPFELTKWASLPDQWGPEEIIARQEKLADLAVKTWRIAP